MSNQLSSLSKRWSIVAAGMAILLAGMPSTAQAEILADFTVDQSGVSNCAAHEPALSCTFEADKMEGNYNEVFTATSATTFATVAYWDLGQFVTDDGTNPVATAFLNSVTNLAFPGTDGYRIYAIFSAEGDFAPDGSGGFTFTATSGSVQLYVDLDQDSLGKTLPAFAPGTVTVPNTADNFLLAEADLAAGEGEGDPGGLAQGDFGLLFNPFELTALGAAFFVEPVPFYMTATLKGQFNFFEPLSAECLAGAPGTFGTATCSQTVNGSADAFFVPEPTSLALLGLGLMGSGWVARRRRTSV